MPFDPPKCQNEGGPDQGAFGFLGRARGKGWYLEAMQGVKMLWGQGKCSPDLGSPPILSATFLTIHSASRGVAAHTAGFFLGP